MAATRAKARALRDLVGASYTAIEELGELDDVIGTGGVKNVANKKKATKRTVKTKPSDDEQESKDSEKIKNSDIHFNRSSQDESGSKDGDSELK